MGRGRRLLAVPVVLAATLALQPAPARDVRLAFIGDGGTGDAAQRRILDQVAQTSPSRVFLLGDNVYSWGEATRIPVVFDKPFAKLLASGVLVHAALGNHDVSGCHAVDTRPLPPDASAYDGKHPGCDVREQLEHDGFGYRAHRRYYSVASEASAEPLAEVFVLDSNTLAARGSKLYPLGDDVAQLQWLDDALGRSKARWKLVTMHHPPHSPSAWLSAFGNGGHEREALLAQQLAPLLQRHHVNVVLAGHNHFYARMRPQAGITYFVVGSGARPPYGFSLAPGYVMAGGAYLAFLSMRITPEAIEFRAVDDAGRVRDAGRIEHPPAPNAPAPRPSASAASAPRSSSPPPPTR